MDSILTSLVKLSEEYKGATDPARAVAFQERFVEWSKQARETISRGIVEKSRAWDPRHPSGYHFANPLTMAPTSSAPGMIRFMSRGQPPRMIPFIITATTKVVDVIAATAGLTKEHLMIYRQDGTELKSLDKVIWQPNTPQPTVVDVYEISIKDENESTTVWITTLTGRNYTIKFNPNIATVADLKMRLYEQMHIPPLQMTLSYTGKVLEDHELMRNTGYEKEGKLNLQLKPRSEGL